jgi:hypothetical protein
MASPPEPRHDPAPRGEGDAGRARRRPPEDDADRDATAGGEEPGSEQLEGGGEGPEEGGDDKKEEEEEEHQARAPWHFKVMVVGSVVYLGYRLYQGISWLVHHI